MLSADTTRPNIRLSDLTIAGFLDSATGKNAKSKSGDYAAIATVGIDRAGYLYVLDLWLRRAAPTAQIEAMFNLHERWNYTLFGIETNCFQQLLLLPIEEERKRRKQAGRPSQFPMREVHHAQAKEMRIATLEPLVSNRWLQFSADLPEPLWAELESFPHGEHDDGLDAIEGAVSLLRSMQTETRTGSPRSVIRKLKDY